MDPTFVSWAVKGLSAVRDFYVNKSFAFFAQLQEKFQIPAGHFFCYLQIRHFVRQSLPLDQLPDKHNFYSFMTTSPTSKGLISQFVSLFTSHISSFHIWYAWIKDTGVEISDGLWEKALEGITACSINARLQLIQYKIIHRLHYSKTKLNKVFPTVSPTCDKCQTSDGTLAHLFWDCLRLSGHRINGLLILWLSRKHCKRLSHLVWLWRRGWSSGNGNLALHLVLNNGWTIWFFVYTSKNCDT